MSKIRSLSMSSRDQPLPASKVESMVLMLAWAIGLLLIASPAFSQASSEPDETPIDLGLGPSPSANDEAEYSLKTTDEGHLVRWIDAQFDLVVAPTTVLSDVRVRRDLNAAIREWEAVGVTPTITVDLDAEPVHRVEMDGTNAIYFVEEGWEFDPQIVALTFTHIRIRDGAIVEMDMAINAEHFRYAGSSDDDERPVHDLQSVFTHEIGHAFGLPDFPLAPEATMYSRLDAGAIHPRELDAIDVAAIEELYFFPENDSQAPGESCPQAPPTTFAFLGLFLLVRRRFDRARLLVGASFSLLLLAPFASPSATANAVAPGAGWVVGREAPRTNLGQLPATDVVIRAKDGRLLRARYPGKVTGEIQPRVLHVPIPERGQDVPIPAFVDVIDSARMR